MRSILPLSLLYLAVAAVPLPEGGNVVRLPLRRQYRPVMPNRGKELVRNSVNRTRRSAAHAASERVGQKITDSGPFDDFGNYRDEVYTIDVTLGTPPVAFNVTLDYQWEYSFFFNAGNPSKRCAYGPMRSRSYYDPKKSSSAVFNWQYTWFGFDMAEPYIPAGCPLTFDGPPCYNDTLTIGPASFASVPVWYMADSLGVLSNTWPSDAVLGLNHDFDNSDDPSRFAFYALLRQLPAAVITVYYDRAESAADLLGGQVTFGGVDTQNCDSKWSYTPNADGDGWSVSTGFSYGKKLSMPKKVEAILESVRSVLTGPPNAVDYVVQFTGAEYDFTSDAYVLSCSKVGTLPDMVFALAGGFDVRVPDKDYIRKLPSNRKDECTLMLSTSFSSDQWWLGTTFGRPYCMQLDYDNRRVGFANILH